MKKLFTHIILLLGISCVAQGSLFNNFFILGNPDESDFLDAVAADNSGNSYLCGRFKETVDFDPSATVFNVSAPGAFASYIVKYGSNNNLIRVKRFLSFSSRFNDIQVDSDGNIIITGMFQGTMDFDPSAAVLNITSAGLSSQDIFVLKLTSNLDLIWVKTMGTTAAEFASTLSVDNLNNIIISGTYIQPLDIDPSPAVFTLSGNVNSKNIFICKLNSSGDFVWAKSIEPNDNVGDASDSKTDANNNIFITGNFRGTADFDTGVGISEVASDANITSDVYILKLNSNGNLNWVRKFYNQGIGGNKFAQNIAINNLGEIYSTVYFSSNTVIDFDSGPGTFLSNAASSSCTAIVKLDNNGLFMNAKILESPPLFIKPEGLALDNNQNPVITGYMAGTTNFGTATNPVNFSSPFISPSTYNNSLFILRLSPQFSFIDFKKINGNAENFSNSQDIAIDANNVMHFGFEAKDNITMGFTGGNTNLYQNGPFQNNVFIKEQLTTVLSNTDFLTPLNISIYPNPTTNILNISLEENANLQIVDMLGKTVFETQLNIGNNTINSSFLNTGIYLIKIQNENKSFVQKLIKN